MKPVISVIFTAGSGVETCRAKLAGQTFKEYEIIEADRFAGLERAHGEYILFVDGSEVYPENMLEKLHDAAEQSGADMVISRCQYCCSHLRWSAFMRAILNLAGRG